MRDGTWEGRGADDPEFRALFTREAVLESDWYRARLEAQRTIDVHLGERQARYLEKFLQRANYADVAVQLDIRGRLDRISASLQRGRDPQSVERLVGTLGAEPSIAAEMSRLASG
jgi:hypothetical protein